MSFLSVDVRNVLAVVSFYEGWRAVIRRVWHRSYHPGDWVVYRKIKRGTAPGPRARRIAPTRYGEEYVYEVKKFYVVEEVGDGYVVVRTRKGRRYRIADTHPRLRHAHWWERWWYRRRFPQLPAPTDVPPNDLSRQESTTRP
jgi:hypothetical protein